MADRPWRATLVFHHNWPTARAAAERPYDASDHALAPFAPRTEEAAAELAPRVTEELLSECAAEIPDEWLADEPGFADPDAVRAAYTEVLASRARTIQERITLGEPSKDGPSQAPGWLTGKGGGAE